MNAIEVVRRRGAPPRPVIDRVLSKIVSSDVPFKGSPCWVFTGSRSPVGYGQIGVGSRSDGTATKAAAHRVTYEAFVGPIPEGLELDHLCSVRSCCNPDHLEPVTHAENVRRGRGRLINGAKTHCKRGHPFDERNTERRKDGGRECLACRVIRNRGLNG